MTEKLDAAEGGQIAWDRDLQPGCGTGPVVIAAFGVADASSYIAGRRDSSYCRSLVGVLTLFSILAVPSRRLRRVDAAHRSSEPRTGPRSSTGPRTSRASGRSAADARAVEADPRLRRRLRHRRPDDRVGPDPGAGGEASTTGGGWAAYAFASSFNRSRSTARRSAPASPRRSRPRARLAAAGAASRADPAAGASAAGAAGAPGS